MATQKKENTNLGPRHKTISLSAMVCVLSLLVIVCAAVAEARSPPHIPCQRPRCGPGAVCTRIDGYEECQCRKGLFGNPYANCTSTPGCTDHEQCLDHEKCGDYNECESPCLHDCPQDILCLVKNHVAECFFNVSLWGPP